MCNKCEKALNLNAHETFWQLLMEKQFLHQVIGTLCTSPPIEDSTALGKQILSNIEENTICYTAGYIIRKIETKFA